MISRDVVIVLTVTIVNLAIGPRTFRPSIYGKMATATYILTAVAAMLFNYLGKQFDRRRSVRLRVARHHRDLEPALYLARGTDHRGTEGRRMKRWLIVLAAGVVVGASSVRLKPDTAHGTSNPAASARLFSGVVSGFSRTVSAQARPKQAVVDTSAGTFIIDLDPGRRARDRRVRRASRRRPAPTTARSFTGW